MILDFFSRKPWHIHGVKQPWGDRPSIHRHLADHECSADGPGDLPDESRVVSASGLSWAPGALDGAFGHHAGPGAANAAEDQVLRALRRLTSRSTDEHAAALYALMVEHPALEYVDALLGKLAGSHLPLDRVRAVTRWLALEAPDREPVKAAIAILGLVSDGEDRPLLLTLGRHEEFTLYVVVALQNTEEDAEPLIWELARHVTGWGRIHIVERLTQTKDERIKGWLLREGCRNSIMEEYTALVCAQAGELLRALRQAEPDEPLLKGAGVILTALMRGGPAEDMRDYPDGPEATRRYLRHLRDHMMDIDDLNVVAEVETFVERECSKTDEGSVGWREAAPTLREHASAIMDRPEWPARIRESLSSRDRSVFMAAAVAARRFGVDPWERHFERIQEGEDDWYFAMQTDDPARIDRMVRLAEERLPLEQIASGPTKEMGLGAAFKDHSALDFVLQGLRPFPGRGWAVIRAGLRSPVTRNRNMAVHALSEWGRETWPAEAQGLLEQAMNDEPDEDVRESLRKLIAGEPLES